MAHIRPEATIHKVSADRKHELRGECVGGRWYFTCPTMPDLANQFDGAETAVACIEEFERRRAAGASKPAAAPIQPTLLDYLSDPDPQAANLGRVRDRIAPVVRAFLLGRLAAGTPEFVTAELHAFVAARLQVAPASADRILRVGRQTGEWEYRVVSRRQSRYRVLRVGGATGEAA